MHALGGRLAFVAIYCGQLLFLPRAQLALSASRASARLPLSPFCLARVSLMHQSPTWGHKRQSTVQREVNGENLRSPERKVKVNGGSTTPLSLLFRCFLVTFLSYLTVVWISIHDEVSKYAGAELESALKQVQDDSTRKWEAINMFRYVLSSVNYPWVIKSHSIDLLLTLVDDKCSEETNSHLDFPYSTQCFATLKAIERVMIAAPDALMRKKAFAALKRVISVVPSTQRFDILQALITNSMFPSLTAILLDLVKNEVLKESCRADQDCIESDRSQDAVESPPWVSHALELVELILRPPEGGPLCLRDHSEQALSALNLLRLILLIDSRGSRSAKILREETIRKVYTEWLIPLRPAVAVVQSELEKDKNEDANQVMCLLNPVKLVLQRCIELVEEKMKGS